MLIGIFGKSKSGKTTLSNTFGCFVLHTDDYIHLGWDRCCDAIINDWNKEKAKNKVIEGIILPRLLKRGLVLDKVIICNSERENPKSVSLDNTMFEMFNKIKVNKEYHNG